MTSPQSDSPAEPTVVRLADLSAPPEQQSAAIQRLEAFRGPDRWIGFARTTEGEWSGWHHHGAMDTYFFVLTGIFEFEYGEDRRTVGVHAGEFAHLPAGVVHRERTVPGANGEAVVVRLGTGPAVINVEGPSAS